MRFWHSCALPRFVLLVFIHVDHCPFQSDSTESSSLQSGLPPFHTVAPACTLRAVGFKEPTPVLVCLCHYPVALLLPWLVSASSFFVPAHHSCKLAACLLDGVFRPYHSCGHTAVSYQCRVSLLYCGTLLLYLLWDSVPVYWLSSLLALSLVEAMPL
jgi:hypothetical protein